MKRTYKILLTEDEVGLRDEVADWLAFEGYQVILAANGKEALEKLKRHTPDLILSDIMMPGMDGKRFLYELRAREQNKMTPFVFMSALSERDHIRHGMELGADDYVSKPFTRDELLKAIEVRLKKHEEQLNQKHAALDSLRSQIISHMPHELRTPLNSIIGFGGLLADMADDFSMDEIAKMGENIMKGGVRMHRLVENYLLFVQLELVKEVNMKTVDASVLESLIYEEVYLIANKYQREGDLKIKIEKADLHIDEFMLRKIIQELVENAFKFSKAGSKVTVSGVNDNADYKIEIEDEGIGMTPAEINNVGAFMQFKRDKNEQQGSGLGLSIVMKMMHILKGAFLLQPLDGCGIKAVCTFNKLI